MAVCSFTRGQPVQEDFRVPLPVDIHNPQHSTGAHSSIMLSHCLSGLSAPVLGSSLVPILDDLYAGEEVYSDMSGDELQGRALYHRATPTCPSMRSNRGCT